MTKIDVNPEMFYTYEAQPLDDFSTLRTVKEYCHAPATKKERTERQAWVSNCLMAIALSQDWEGDVIQAGVTSFELFAGDRTDRVLVIKQSNNGTTYLATNTARKILLWDDVEARKVLLMGVAVGDVTDGLEAARTLILEGRING